MLENSKDEPSESGEKWNILMKVIRDAMDKSRQYDDKKELLKSGAMQQIINEMFEEIEENPIFDNEGCEKRMDVDEIMTVLESGEKSEEVEKALHMFLSK